MTVNIINPNIKLEKIKRYDKDKLEKMEKLFLEYLDKLKISRGNYYGDDRNAISREIERMEKELLKLESLDAKLRKKKGLI